MKSLPASLINAKSLSQLIDAYIKEFVELNGCFSDAELKVYKNLTLENAVKKAALARDENGNFFPHQWNLKGLPDIPTKVEKILSQHIAEIRSCENFDTLHEFIKSKIFMIPFVGVLYCYDTAFRIGINIGIFPDSIYLHAGTKTGASALGIHLRGKVTLEKSELVKIYPEFSKLKPYQIEDCLCITRTLLHKFRRTS